MTLPTPAQTTTLVALQTMAKSVSGALIEFEKWLVAAYAASIAFAVPHLQEVAAELGARRVYFALGFVAAAVVLSLIVLFMGMMVSASVAGAEAVQKELPDRLKSAVGDMDLEMWRVEQLRGLWWPGSAGFRWSMRRLDEGDWAASGRLVAKLSQLQTYLVILQVLLGLAAAGTLASGLHL